MNYKLKDVIAGLPGVLEWRGDPSDLNIDFRGLSTDSRNVRPGNLFVALRGERFDGHDFVEKALQEGAAAAVVDRAWLKCKASGSPGNRLLVTDDTLDALQWLANFHRRHFSIPVLALTGTAGKTTTKEFIASVLSTSHEVLKNQSSFNNAIGVSLTLAQLNNEHEIAVSELGTNHPGEILALTEVVEPTLGMILNVGRGHLEFFGSVEGVLKEKYSLVHWLREHSRGPVFLNSDDELIRSNAPKGVNIVWFGTNSRADICVRIVGTDGVRAVIEFNRQRVRLSLPGLHHAANAAAAVAMGEHFEIPARKVAEALATVRASPHRGQVYCVSGVTLIDDAYNCNPESARVALDLLRRSSSARKIAVLGDMLELGRYTEPEHEKLGRELTEYNVSALFAFGEYSAYAVKGADAVGLKALHFSNKRKLAAVLMDELQQGDAVLFKGSRAMQMEQVFEEVLSKLRRRESTERNQ